MLKKYFFDDLNERFCFKSRFGNFGILCVFRNFQTEELEQKMRPNPKRVVFRGAKNKNWIALISDPTVMATYIVLLRYCFDSASQRFVTVRQILSDDPARKIQAFSLLRRSPLSVPADAWPYREVLMNTAPLSERFNFSLY